MISSERKDSSDTAAESSSNFQAHILDSILNEDISDTGEDLTTETISKGKLKHEMRMLQTRFIKDAAELQNSKTLSKAREDELLEQIKTLSIRLNLASARYDTLLEATTESSELKADLAETIACKRRLLNENEELHSQLNLIRNILIANLPKNLEYIDMNQINISEYSLLSSEEFDTLNNKSVDNLSTLDLVKLWIHKFFSFIIQTFIRNGITVNNCNIETNRKHVQFIDTTPVTLSSNSSLSNVQLGKDNQCIKQLNQNPSHYEKKTNSKNDKNISVDSDNIDRNKEESVELQVIKKQIHLMKLDKEYFLKQLSHLRQQLTIAEEKITSQQKLIIELESNSCRIANKNTYLSSQLQLPFDLNASIKNQTGELSKLIQNEFERLKSIDQELHNKEVILLREQKENAITECTNLKSQLKQAESMLCEYKEKIDEMKNSNTIMNIEHDNQLREKIKTTLMNLEIEQAARKDASLEIEKLNVQLEFSKKSYYELECRFNQEKIIWKIKEENYEKKLRLYELTEKEMNELLLTNLQCDTSTLINTPNSFSKPTINTTYLIKTIQHLKMEISNLQSELVRKSQEIEELNKGTNRESPTNSQPTGGLYQTLSQRDSQIHALHNQLADIEKQSLLYKEERDKLAYERNLLCEDLERLLTRRQSLTKLRDFILSLLQQIQSDPNVNINKCIQHTNDNRIFYPNQISIKTNPAKGINRVSNIHQQVYDSIRSP
ncbi:hypothetical protein MN116_001848 [Schistosoma mekongi]|uniref:Progesterone-induced-blocking factor 1 n=1 Tax=Schistosoma mekongi TaxID=38744 RepID=A0AAE1ZIX9_SCHME|nr:hypothetical protein MN116_001848 [Schistosoma mekongi]